MARPIYIIEYYYDGTGDDLFEFKGTLDEWRTYVKENGGAKHVTVRNKTKQEK